MPHVLDVPEFTGIRIHAGNTAADTSGCILLGLSRAPDYVGQSTIAYNRFLAAMQIAITHGEEVTLAITKESVGRNGEIIY
jgi:hypothetical protein